LRRSHHEVKNTERKTAIAKDTAGINQSAGIDDDDQCLLEQPAL
jgi:hypothetical protein